MLRGMMVAVKTRRPKASAGPAARLATAGRWPLEKRRPVLVSAWVERETTLMRTLCGLIQPTRGEVLWDGEPIRRQGEDFTRELLYVGHKNSIKDDLTGVENLRISCVLDGLAIDHDQAWDALEKMGLRGHEDLPVRALSQGQKRRVAVRQSVHR